MKQHCFTYTDFLARLDTLGLFHTDMGLERISSAIKPLASHLQQIHFIHVVGTNGKGSTSVFIESLARAHGLKTGLFTSPHFLTPRERLRINGKKLNEKKWEQAVNKAFNYPASDRLTYFELLTLIALLFFIEYKVDIAILEAGLGGTWDATCALDFSLSVLTPVGLDHEKVLGSTLESIAKDKAGTLRGGLAISAHQQKDVRSVFTRVAQQTKTSLFWSEHFYKLQKHTLFFEHEGHTVHIPLAQLGLPGSFQAHNAALALGAWSLFCQKHHILWSPTACIQGLKTAFHPGRFQLTGKKPLFILDGAHNVMGLQALVSELKEKKIAPDYIIFSCMADKNIDTMLLVLCQLQAQTIVPGIPGNPRAADPEELASKMGADTVSAPDMRSALNLISPDAGIVLVCGSLYLLAEFYALYPHLLENQLPEKETKF